MESYGLKEICDDFFADKSLMPKFHKREGMDFFSKALAQSYLSLIQMVSLNLAKTGMQQGLGGREHL